MPEKWDPTVSSSFRARNYQTFELGLDHLNDNDDYIQDSFLKPSLICLWAKLYQFSMHFSTDLGNLKKKSLEKLRSQFDLILLTEYMLESLVLLADLLCVPYTVVFTPRDKSIMEKGEEVMRELKPTQLKKFEKFFKQDIKGVVVETILPSNRSLLEFRRPCR